MVSFKHEPHKLESLIFGFKIDKGLLDDFGDFSTSMVRFISFLD